MFDRRQLALFFTAIAIVVCGQSLFEATFNNYLSDTFHISALERGWIEFPRELPGFLVVATTGALCLLAVTRVGMIAACLMVLGFGTLSAFGDRFGGMMGGLLMASTGIHMLMPVTATIALTMSHEHQRGRRLGQMGLFETIGLIVGFGAVCLFYDRDHPQYRAGFFAAMLIVMAGVAVYAMMRLPHLHAARTPLVLRRQYSLYYVLELLAGARKQIFLTFGPWVLIRVYGQPARDIAMLLLIAAVIGIVFKPLAGWLIDRFGERSVMLADNVTLIFICLGYGYALWLMGGNHDHARRLACACFIGDNLLFTLGNARSVYLSRISRSNQDLTSTLAMGVTVNHLVSMTVPIAAGRIWEWLGYESLFLCAAVLAVVIAAVSLAVPRRKIPAPLPSPGAPAVALAATAE